LLRWPSDSSLCSSVGLISFRESSNAFVTRSDVTSGFTIRPLLRGRNLMTSEFNSCRTPSARRHMQTLRGVANSARCGKKGASPNARAGGRCPDRAKGRAVCDDHFLRRTLPVRDQNTDHLGGLNLFHRVGVQADELRRSQLLDRKDLTYLAKHLQYSVGRPRRPGRHTVTTPSSRKYPPTPDDIPG
jgi:hypothetical protein